MQASKPKSRKSAYIGAAVLVIVIVAAASTYLYYSSTAPKPLVFTANLVSSEEVPPNTSPATGTATVTISADGTTLHFVVVVNNQQDHKPQTGSFSKIRPFVGTGRVARRVSIRPRPTQGRVSRQSRSLLAAAGA